MKRALKAVPFNREFRLPDDDNIYNLVKYKDARRDSGVYLVPVADRHGRQKWVNWDTEVEVLGEPPPVV